MIENITKSYLRQDGILNCILVQKWHISYWQKDTAGDPTSFRWASRLSFADHAPCETYNPRHRTPYWGYWGYWGYWTAFSKTNSIWFRTLKLKNVDEHDILFWVTANKMKPFGCLCFWEVSCKPPTPPKGGAVGFVASNFWKYCQWKFDDFIFTFSLAFEDQENKSGRV